MNADTFRMQFDGIEEDQMQDLDLTEAYKTARRRCFEACTRREITAPVGGAYLLHRHSLHGVQPWKDTDTAPPEGRIVAYFRPEFQQINQWLTA